MSDLGPLIAGYRDRVRERILRRPGSPLELRLAVEAATLELVRQDRLPLAPGELDQLVQAVVDDAVGLGPLDPLLHDPEVTEVIVNGPERVWAERDGVLHRERVAFDDELHLRHVIERIVGGVGRRIDESSPMVDARLPDGSRVNAVLPPLAVDGPLLTVRKFARDGMSLGRLVELGSLPETHVTLLEASIAARLNIVISGGTGTGKTTLLNALAGVIDARERIVTVEDAAELRLPQPNVARLESRPANVEGRGEVTVRALVRNALRMRPDRIVVGEVRGGEALDMLQALNTGHDGSLTTVHSSSPVDAIRRIETMAMMAGTGIPHSAVREQVTAAVDVVVHLVRESGGARRVRDIEGADRRMSRLRRLDERLIHQLGDERCGRS
jgi:pilus assembly protein CpaF